LQHNPIYKALRTHLPDREITNNFFKYLIGRDGVPVGYYTHQQTLFDIEAAIKDELESI
jgi:glutathione peroxidase-family protein